MRSSTRWRIDIHVWFSRRVTFCATLFGRLEVDFKTGGDQGVVGDLPAWQAFQNRTLCKVLSALVVAVSVAIDCTERVTCGSKPVIIS
ncbi:MAG: hypothetical protein R3C56_28185 [Pirellulaceae bacterium]